MNAEDSRVSLTPEIREFALNVEKKGSKSVLVDALRLVMEEDSKHEEKLELELQDWRHWLRSGSSSE